MVQLTKVQKGMALLIQDQRQQQVATQVGVNILTIECLAHRLRKNGKLAHRLRSGRPSAMTRL